jgi:membrane-associated protease RseP (regulator of RpoE activity)
LAPNPEDAPVQPPPFIVGYVSVPRIPLDVESRAGLPPHFLRATHPRDRVWVHVVLFLATLVTTSLVGTEFWASHLLYAGRFRPDTSYWSLVPGGLWYSLALMAILTAHEMGHYLTCVHYKVNATLPYFLPVPPPFISGTMGAFIRIRDRFRTKKQVFDVGIAGPLAGFAVAVPVLFIGLALSTYVAPPKNLSGIQYEFADPLLFKIAGWMVFGNVREGLILNAHPMVFAAWVGCLVTSLNLFPALQLDGGHIAYAVFGRHARKVTYATVAVTAGLTIVSPTSWIAWTVLMVVMMKVFGASHPSTPDEEAPIGRARIALAVLAAVVLILCFMVKPLDTIILGK